jgi:4'-phosphopantetheinyl transferase
MTGPRVAVDVWSLELTRDERAEREACAVLTAEECARALRFRRPEDRAAFVRTRALARAVLGRKLEVDPATVEIVEGCDGKPTITGVHNPPHFNVSHSGTRALVAVCRSQPIGVDVEQKRELDWRAVADAHFAPAELARIASCERAARPATFFDCWVAKEAYLKGVGVGLRRRTDDFVVPPPDTDIPVHDRDSFRRGPRDARWHLRRLDVGIGYAAALAVATEAVAITVRPLDALVGHG